MAISDHPLTFAEEGVQEFQSVGRFIRVRTSSSPLYFSIDGAAEIEREQGEQIDTGRESTRVRVRSAVAQSVYITSSGDRQDDNRQAVNLNVAATVEGGNDNQHLPVVTIAAASSLQIAGSNLARKTLRVALPSDAVGPVTLGKSGVSAASGGLLEPGMVDYIDTQGALYAFNDNASPVDVYVLEINKL